MIEVRVQPPEPAARGYVRHVAELRSDHETRQLRIMAPEDAHPLSEDWLVLPALTYGMRQSEDVRIHGRVSAMLMANLDEIQAMFLADAEARRPLHRIEFEATQVVPTPTVEGAGTVSLFSGGLDAFYTAIQRRDDIDALLFLHGQEATPDDREQLFVTLPHVKAAAAGLEKPLLLIDSDHWDLIWRDGGRTETSNHAMLVTMGYLLGSKVRRILVSGSYEHEFEYGRENSVAKLLPLLQTEALEVELYANLARAKKMRVVVESPVAMDHLRVCWARRGGAFNCGVCRKCLRTLVNLEIVGATGRCRTLPPTVDLRAVARTPIGTNTRDTLQRENLRLAKAGGLTELARALETSVGPRFELLKRMPRPLARFVKSFRHAERKRRRKRTREALEAHRQRTDGAHLFVSLPPAAGPAYHPAWDRPRAQDRGDDD